MTGTSLDGLDVAAIAWPSETGQSPRLLDSESGDLGEAEQTLSKLASGVACTAAEIARAGLDFADAHLRCMNRLADQVGRPDLIALHGQTVFHEPPRSWQLMNPWPIASAFGVPVVSDLRGLDIASGGEGAPITPLSDLVWFGSPDERRVVLNLGGFANATVLPKRADQSEVRGFDICACNHVLNQAAREALGEPFDRGGAAAMRGLPDPTLVDSLADVLQRQARQSRSLGTLTDLSVSYAAGPVPTGDDLLASVAAAVGRVIGETVGAQRPDLVLCAGGGAFNLALLEAIRRSCPAEVVLSDSVGMPVQMREAAAIATLGAMAADARRVTLPHVTGRRETGDLIDGLWCLPRSMADASGVWRAR
jgi:1,6-anhydro-N-acetylmuramate kinase